MKYTYKKGGSYQERMALLKKPKNNPTDKIWCELDTADNDGNENLGAIVVDMFKDKEMEPRAGSSEISAAHVLIDGNYLSNTTKENILKVHNLFQNGADPYEKKSYRY